MTRIATTLLVTGALGTAAGIGYAIHRHRRNGLEAADPTPSDDNDLAASGDLPMSICPTYLLVRDGTVVGRLEGNQPYPMLAAALDSLVGVEPPAIENETNLQGNGR